MMAASSAAAAISHQISVCGEVSGSGCGSGRMGGGGVAGHDHRAVPVFQVVAQTEFQSFR
jgi:hypothetical protein